ncbi:MAG: glycosyltransferase family 39 protein, partial [Acidobacteria bacterium]|nr:glycosyltransferase family 39 protein [Acidobacteriota bacterium]
MSALRSFGALRALLLASAILLFVDVGASTIWDANEAFYVETPRQMVLTGDYVNPSFNGAPRFNKPVLNYWIVAGFYNVLGVSVTSERLAIAVGALMLVFATFVIGRTLGGTNAGVAAALVLASAPRVMLWSRRIFIDIYFASFLAL